MLGAGEIIHVVCQATVEAIACWPSPIRTTEGARDYENLDLG